MASAKDLLKRARSFDWDGWAETFREDFEPLYRDLVVLGGDESADVVDEAFDVDDPFTSRFMTDYIGERIVQLQETTKARVVDIIRTQLESDEGATSAFELGTRILDTVRQTFDGYERYRADRIARTETGFAYNHGTVLGASQAGFDEVDVFDGEDDEPCAEANGAVWTIDDALANALEHPNCTRSFAPHADDEQDHAEAA